MNCERCKQPIKDHPKMREPIEVFDAAHNQNYRVRVVISKQGGESQAGGWFTPVLCDRCHDGLTWSAATVAQY